MKKIISILFLSFAIIGCETPSSQDSDFPTFIDSEELEGLANTIQDALNSGDVETALTYYADEASWLFPNGVEVEGKEAIGEMLTTTSSMWDISSSDDTNYLAFEGSDENEEGEEVRFRVLMSWGPTTFTNDDTTITIPYHSVQVFFGEDNKLGWQSGFYDRTKFVEYYDEDIIK
tara:strand:+ start:65 stop:589 length:525 start_codon:yes stop_codon:yes gene_type:complete